MDTHTTAIHDMPSDTIDGDNHAESEEITTSGAFNDSYDFFPDASL